jgi:hypothetical protein
MCDESTPLSTTPTWLHSLILTPETISSSAVFVEHHHVVISVALSLSGTIGENPNDFLSLSKLSR